MKKNTYIKFSLSLIRPIKYSFYFAVFVMIISQILLFVFPYMNKLIIDRFLVIKDYSNFWLLIFFYLAVMILSNNGFAINRYITTIQSEEIIINFRKKVMSSLFNKNFIDFHKNTYGEIDTILTNNISSIIHTIYMTAETIVGNPFFLIMSIGYIFSISFKLCLFLVGEIVLMFFATKFFAPRFADKYNQQLVAESNYSRNLERTYNSFEDTRLNFLSFFALNRLFKVFFQLREKNISNMKIEILAQISYSFIEILVDIGALLYCIYLIKNNQMTVGDYFAFIGIKPAFIGAFNAFSQLNINFSRLKVAVDKIWEVIPYEYFINEIKNHKFVLKEKINSLKLSHIDFKYNDKFIIKNLNYKFEINNIYIISGENGAGKTTLLRILSGLCKPLNGDIIINDKLYLKTFKEESITKHIKILSQYPRLFDDNIRNNLCHSYDNDCKNVFNDRFKELNKFLNIENILKTYQNGIDSNIFENGKNLSGGQVKQVCIARTLLYDAEVIIFDEPMSNLDKINKQKFYDFIKLQSPNKIIIIISHQHNWSWNNNEIFLELKKDSKNRITLSEQKQI
ncbi:MAG: ABC transporter ATP-binding protein [Candidatus Cloacimonetes bacterium]|nr:ABC transporter ATP-binding protein [Candidatus Cloacimonadota bacterium]